MDIYGPGSGPPLHDFNGDFPGTPLYWTVRLPDDAVVIEKKGRRLTVDVTDVPVVDLMPAAPGSPVPATVSFRIVWKARGAARRLGRAKAPDGDPAAFSARLRTATRATGVFSGAAGAFTFQSDPARPVKSVFAALGTERNGSLRPGAASRCVACAAPPGTDGPAW